MALSPTLISLSFTVLGVIFMALALVLMPRSHLRASLNALTISSALIGILAAILSSVNPGADKVPIWIAPAAASFVFAQGAYFLIQGWKIRRIAAIIARETPVLLAKSVPEVLKDANMELRERIERATNFPYYPVAAGFFLVPLVVVALYQILGG